MITISFVGRRGVALAAWHKLPAGCRVVAAERDGAKLRGVAGAAGPLVAAMALGGCGLPAPITHHALTATATSTTIVSGIVSRFVTCERKSAPKATPAVPDVDDGRRGA
jgi:hypothetical protein